MLALHEDSELARRPPRRLPPGVKLMAVADLDIRMPINLVWRKDNPSPLIPRFVDLLCGQNPRG